MSSISTNEHPPVSEARIQSALAQVSELEPAYAAAQREARGATAKVRELEALVSYCRLLLAIRGVGLWYEFWPIGLALVVPVMCGAIVWAMAFSLNLNVGLTAFLVLLAAGGALAICTLLLWFPSTVAVERRLKSVTVDLVAAENLVSRSKAALSAAEVPYLAAKRNHESLVAQLADWHREKELERQRYLQSLQFRREQLISSNWRSYRSVEFEQFLKEVFECLGHHVETTKVSGDQGIDLIVHIGNRRLAVQAKGYFNSVGNGAVQEAYAGCRHYNCHVCAVITNSRFTPSAIELAQSVNCILIDEDRMRDFVMGNIAF